MGLSLRIRMILVTALVLFSGAGAIWFLVRPNYEKSIIDERTILISQIQNQQITEVQKTLTFWIGITQNMGNMVLTAPQNLETTFNNFANLFPDLSSMRVVETASGEFFEIRKIEGREHLNSDQIRQKISNLRADTQVRGFWDLENGIIVFFHQVGEGRNTFDVSLLFEDINVKNDLVDFPYGEGVASVLWDEKSQSTIEGDSLILTPSKMPTVDRSSAEKRIVATSPIPFVEVWHSLVASPSIITKPVEGLFKRNLLVLLGVTLILLVATWFLATLVRRPVQLFLDDVKPFESYDFSKPIRNSSLPELSGFTVKMEEIRTLMERYKKLNVERIIVEQQKSEVLINFAQECVALSDSTRRINFINARFKALLDDLGIEKQPTTIEDFKEFGTLTPKKEKIDSHLQEHLAISTEDNEITLYNKENQPYHFGFHSLVVHSVEEGLIGGMLILYDLTQERMIDRMRNEMISLIIHEMRNPVTGALGLTDILLSNEINAETSLEFHGLIKQSLMNLSNMINRFLKISSLELSSKQIQKVPIAVDSILEQIAEEILPSLHKNRLSVDTNFPPNFPKVGGDEEILTDVFRNLLSNAIKYGDEFRTIEVDGMVEANRVVVSVTDHGFGISEENQKMIFQKFYRIKEHKHITGTGLGLSFVKEAIERHGGELTVTSNPDIGARFSVHLPLAEAT